MAKRKGKQQCSSKEGASSAGGSRPSTSSSISYRDGRNLSTAAMGAGTSNASPKSTTSKKPPPSTLLICRNKHWRHISCYHGAWLQMPFEVLEAIAHINYNTSQPRPIDPGSSFDTLKVRRLVDEATNLAVRAASDIASPMLTSVNSVISSGGPGHGAKLSRERKFRMREQACQKLARAYRLDEISCSVATMQGASPLEEVGKLVLQRSPGDADARYVNFFHEKIPSRQMAEWTSLQPLTDTIADRPEEPEVLRTRAFVRVFKRDFDGAILDLTRALSAYRCARSSHDPKPARDNMQVSECQRIGTKRRPNDIILSEKEQPTSFEGQILFQRASVYLSLACEHARAGMPAPRQSSGAHENKPNGSDAEKPGNGSHEEPHHRGELERQAESRKRARHFAKRAIKDFLAFLSQFHYSPDYPTRAVREYADRVSSLSHSGRYHREVGGQQLAGSHTVYSLPELFAAVAPADLPHFPAPEQQRPPTSTATCEWMTFHPLLTDSLHSLLLCHLLLQTSVKELQRHAHMAARLIRLADGFPLFHPSRSPSRADWLEILRREGNWLQLADTWERLTSPALIPGLLDPEPQRKRLSDSSSSSSSSSSSASPSPSPSTSTSTIKAASLSPTPPSTPKPNKHQTQQPQSNLKPTDETPKTTPTKPPPPPPTTTATTNTTTSSTATTPSHGDELSKWLEDTREVPLLTDRAASLARWLREAPPLTGPSSPSSSRRRKKSRKPAAAAAAAAAAVRLEGHDCDGGGRGDGVSALDVGSV